MKTHVIRKMSQQGDTETKYDPTDPTQVAMAEKVFNDMKATSHLMYKLDEEKKGVGMHTFDPTAETIYAHEPLVGG